MVFLLPSRCPLANSERQRSFAKSLSNWSLPFFSSITLIQPLIVLNWDFTLTSQLVSLCQDSLSYISSFIMYQINFWARLCYAILSHFSHVRLCVTLGMAAHQAAPSLGFSRQEHWSGLPFPSPMHESEKWKWSRSVVSNSQRPHGLQPTRLLHPWDFPGKSTGVGCHCLLPEPDCLCSNPRSATDKLCDLWASYLTFPSQFLPV